MANTEKFKVLKLIREAKSAARDARFTPGLDPTQSKVIEDLYMDLEKTEDDLILAEIDERIDAIKKSSTQLTKVSKKIRKDIKKLKKVADAIDKAAKGLKILADIAVKAGSLGIV
jgi:hypothetical protein